MTEISQEPRREAMDEVLACLCQYRDDLRYPPTGDSIQRRLARAEALIAKLKMVDETKCRNCGGEGWVCENHADKPWAGTYLAPESCGCGAGMPCGACNLELACSGYVDRERQRISSWLRAMPANYSGWNDHDEQYDAGYNAAVAAVAGSIEKREDAAPLALSLDAESGK